MHRRTFLAAVASATTILPLAGCVDIGGQSRTPTTGTTTGTSTSTRAGTETTRSPPPDGISYLRTPDGFVVEQLVGDTALGGGEFNPGPEPGPRMMAVSGDSLLVTVPSQDRVVVLSIGSGSTGPVEPTTVLDGLDRPHGIAVEGGYLYLAQAGDVVRFALDGTSVDPSSKAVLVDDVPSGRYHWTRSIAIHADRLYLSAGVCVSGRCSAGTEEYLGAITSFDLDGSNPTTYANGLRNAVGIGWHDGTFYATDNGADDLGNDRPPDEVDVVRRGADYGFPACYGNNVPDPKRGSGAAACRDATPPAVLLPAHCAPLGFDVYDGEAFPPDYRGDLYVALHGSWVRPDPTGFSIVRIPMAGGNLGTPTDFVTGWLPDGGGSKDARGRPVDVLVGPTGDLYVTDDLSGAIYRIRYYG